MCLLAEWAFTFGRKMPTVLTVDHGLTPGSDRVANAVAKRAQALGMRAQILAWRGRKPTADVERAARDARYRLMGRWCRAHEIPALYVAHTLEDQAETFLLRLARGSGVDGLAAMAPVSRFPLRDFDDIRVVRPLLRIPRSQLRSYLTDRDLDWHEDAMNDDPRFARVRLRAAWPSLVEAGLSAERIADAAGHLARARAALDHNVVALLSCVSQIHEKSVLIDRAALAAAPREIGLRALAHLLMQISRSDYRPRFERLEGLFSAICEGELAGGRTLHGCVVKPASKRLQRFGPGTLAIGPEPAKRR
jgi:tRNA(Ile)-lysidine synthase